MASQSSNADDAGTPRPLRPCPVCGTPIDPLSKNARAYRPFCSRACADVDLLRWLRGAYVIPGKDADDDEDGERALGTASASDDPSFPGSRGNGDETR